MPVGDARRTQEPRFPARCVESAAPEGISAHGLAGSLGECVASTPHPGFHFERPLLADGEHLRWGRRGSASCRFGHHRFDCLVALVALGADRGDCRPLLEPGCCASLLHRQACAPGAGPDRVGRFRAPGMRAQCGGVAVLVSPQHPGLSALMRTRLADLGSCVICDS